MNTTKIVYAITVDTIDHNIAGDLGTATWFGPGTQDGWVGLPMCYIVTTDADALELHLMDNTNVRGMERMHGWTAADAAVNAAGDHRSAAMMWDWHTYGSDSFNFHILEVMPPRGERWLYRAREALWMHEVGEAYYNVHIYSERARIWLGVA